jgi:hemerythrin-like domain-containing protein
MSKAIEMLMHEHRFIEKMLGALETFAGGLEPGSEQDRKTVGEFGEFFANFADKCHHGKEEDRLFKKMEEHGMPSDEGPIAVMLSDHREGREHVGSLRAVGAGQGPLSQEECDSVKQNAYGYAAMLRMHIQKEDNILYPMSMQMIPEAEMDRLALEFDEFEANVMGAGVHEHFHEVGHRLVEAYPPSTEAPGIGESHGACCGHAH